MKGFSVATEPELKPDGKYYRQDDNGQWLVFNSATRQYEPAVAQEPIQPPAINIDPYIASDGNAYKRVDGVDLIRVPGTNDSWVVVDEDVQNPRHLQDLGDTYKRTVGQQVPPEIPGRDEPQDPKVYIENARRSKLSRRRVAAIVVAGIVGTGVAAEVGGSVFNRDDCNTSQFEPNDVAGAVMAANGIPDLSDPIQVSTANGAAIRVVDSVAAPSCGTYTKQLAVENAMKVIERVADINGNASGEGPVITTTIANSNGSEEPSVSDTDIVEVPPTTEDKNVYCDSNGIVTGFGKDVHSTAEQTGSPAKGPCVIDLGH